jgi:CRISPR-associated Csx2 family protein
MPRNIFLSFLGTSNYQTIRYFADENKNALPPLRFVQEATLQLHCSHFGKNDQIIIFTTPTAHLRNWKDYEHIEDICTKSKALKEGLEKRLEALNPPCAFKAKEIPEGKSPAEIWEIFNIVFSELKENDRVTFDITHSFRSLPMLNMVLINYARLLKNITVEGIYYGAFEAKEKNEAGENCAPIWNLKAFSDIQNWTNNARIFLKTGNASPLAKQITTEPYQEIKESLLNFSQFNLVNRGMDIFSGKEMLKLHKALSQPIDEDDPAVSALLPILEKIKGEFQHYKENEAYNGFHAVRWCIHNGLLQQAATLMEEFITTLVMLDLGETELNNHKKRKTFSAALTIGENEDFRFDHVIDETEIDGEKVTIEKVEASKEHRKWQESTVPKIRAYSHKKEFGNLAGKIKNSIRNDVNHAGFRADPRDYSGFKESLIKRYKELQKLLKRIKNVELSNLEIN